MAITTIANSEAKTTIQTSANLVIKVKFIVNPIILPHLPCWLLFEEELFNVSNSAENISMLVDRMTKRVLQDVPLLEAQIDALMARTNDGLPTRLDCIV